MNQGPKGSHGARTLGETAKRDMKNEKLKVDNG